MFRNVLALTFALCAICVDSTANDVVPPGSLSPEESAALEFAESQGLAIFLHDHAASVASDAAQAIEQFKTDKRVRSWVTEQQGRQIIVTFLSAVPDALYRVIVTDGIPGAVVVLNPPLPLTAYEASAATARAAAATSEFPRCTRTYNSVVLPPRNAQDWTVYFLPASTSYSIVPVGGTYRFSVKDSQIAARRGFTETCIALQSPPEARDLVISHTLDPVPTEAHVFWSLWAKKPIVVATTLNTSMWVVEGKKIRLLERNPPATAK